MNKLLGAALTATLTLAVALPAAADHKTGHGDPFAKRNADRAAAARLAPNRDGMTPQPAMTMAQAKPSVVDERSTGPSNDSMPACGCCNETMKPQAAKNS